MELKGRSIVSIRDFPREEIESVVAKALDVKAGKHANALEGKRRRRRTSSFFICLPTMAP